MNNFYKIKAFHLLTDVNHRREIASIKSISMLSRVPGVEYIQVINSPYKDLPPIENCARPNCVAMTAYSQEKAKTIGNALTPGHYGCYKAHTDLLLSIPDNQDELIVIFECDAVLKVSPEAFISAVISAKKHMNKYDMLFFSFGPVFGESSILEDFYISESFFEAHCYLTLPKHIKYIKHIIRNTPWDVFDLWATNAFHGALFGYIKHSICVQDTRLNESLVSKEKNIIKKV